ncbi:carboxypeptidase regulatory-like domain-containing protein, partial [Micromonospora fluostatini]
MSTHRRAWKRAGVVVALVAGALFAVPATPALAADVVGIDPGQVSLRAGSEASFTVQLRGEEGENATISVNGLPNGVSCASGCGQITLGGDGNGSQQVVLRADGNARDGNGSATVSAGGQGRNVQVRVQGRQEPEPEPTREEVQTVRSVSGKVVAQANGDAVANAIVILLDGNGRRHETNSDGSGNFRFGGSSSNPIVPGQL